MNCQTTHGKLATSPVSSPVNSVSSDLLASTAISESRVTPADRLGSVRHESRFAEAV